MAGTHTGLKEYIPWFCNKWVEFLSLFYNLTYKSNYLQANYAYLFAFLPKFAGKYKSYE